MGLRDVLQERIARAFSTSLADCVSSITLIKTSPDVYDPVTGTTSTAIVEVAGRGVFLAYLARKDGPELLADCTDSMIVLLSEVPDIELTSMVKRGTETYEVLSVKRDPADASAEVFLRRISPQAL